MLCYKDEEKYLPHSSDQNGGGGRCQVISYTLTKIHLHCCVTSSSCLCILRFFIILRLAIVSYQCYFKCQQMGQEEAEGGWSAGS